MNSTKSTQIRNYEIIGKEIEVVESMNSNLVGMSGLVLNETKETFVVERLDSTRKTLLKANSIFDINIGNESMRVSGNSIRNRTEEMIIKQ